ncbi:MAG: hypothetical protein QOD39_3267, partial [Mycobacterium sp.]|nr:hypothetical protein [Mycobacterium sp.]
MEHDDQNQPHRVIHPAKFTNVILDVIGKHVPEGSLVLDPFAG